MDNNEIVLAKLQRSIENIVSQYRQTKAAMELLGGKPKSEFFLFVDDQSDRQLIRNMRQKEVRSPELKDCLEDMYQI